MIYYHLIFSSLKILDRTIETFDSKNSRISEF